MDEQRFRPAWRSFYWHYAAIVVVFLLSIKVGLSLKYQKAAGIFFLVFLAYTLFDMVHRRFGVLLIVKPDEIALEKGLFGRDSIEINTKNIRTIQVKQNLVQRIMNVGNILVASSGTDGYEIQVKDLYAPHDIRNLMQINGRAPQTTPAAGEETETPE